MTIQFINSGRKRILREMILKDVREINPKKILDNGCGKFGSWDYNKTPELKIDKIDLIYGDDSENLKFENNKFDCVVFAGVIQYLNDPIRAVRECNRVLKKDGTLIIATVNANSLLNNITKFKAESTTYTMNGIKNILKSEGFEVFEERFVDFSVIPKTRRMILYLKCRKLK